MTQGNSKTPSQPQQDKRKNQVGVWLDHHQAFVISAADGDFALTQTLETTAPGHNRTSEHTINKAEKALILKHFHAVAEHLAAYDTILLFGPGTAQEEMRNLLGDHVQFRGKTVAIDSASQMTKNQMVAQVREFFDNA